MKKKAAKKKASPAAAKKAVQPKKTTEKAEQKKVAAPPPAEPEILDARHERDEKVQALLAGIQKQNPDALAQFFEEFSDDIYNFPMRMFRFNEDEASEFYLYAFEHLRDGRKIASFQGKAKFTTWFYAVLRNLTIDFLRSQKDKVRFTTYLKADASGKMEIGRAHV